MKSRPSVSKGFTLVELMIVVAIIGLVAAIAVPGFLKARNSARNSRFTGDLRTARQAFIVYSMEQGAYPADETPAVTPSGMGPYLGRFDWTADTVLGGQWDWDYKVFGITAGVSVYRPSSSAAEMAKIDGLLDDGNLNTGSFRSRANGYVSILE
jgi:general secretion pathway protein G